MCRRKLSQLLNRFLSLKQIKIDWKHSFNRNKEAGLKLNKCHHLRKWKLKGIHKDLLMLEKCFSNNSIRVGKRQVTYLINKHHLGYLHLLLHRHRYPDYLHHLLHLHRYRDCRNYRLRLHPPYQDYQIYHHLLHHHHPYQDCQIYHPHHPRKDCPHLHHLHLFIQISRKPSL